MQKTNQLARPCLRVLLLTSAMCAIVSAENGRNFAGSYQLLNVIQGSAVQFDIKANVINNSGQSIQNATVTIDTPGIHPIPLEAADFQGSITGVKVAYHKVATLSGTFTVSLREYQQWQRGALPNMVITYINTAGKEVHDHVELAPAVGQLR